MAILDEIREPPFEQLLSWHPVDNTLIDLRQGDVNFLNINSPLTHNIQFTLNKAILLKHSMFVYKFSCSAEMGVGKSKKNKTKQRQKRGAGILTDGNFT